MIVTITLTTAGSDTGPFNLYSDVDGYVSAFEVGVSKAALIAGYTSTLVPNGTTIVRVMSASALCTNYVDITIGGLCTPACKTYIVSNPDTGGLWEGISCDTGLPVSGIVPGSSKTVTDCIVDGSLVLTNAFIDESADCYPTTTTTTTI